MKTMIPTEVLAAALHCAGKQQIRYYLNGVFMELRNGECRATASDGNIACTMRYQSVDGFNTDLIIPREVIELALKTRVVGGLELDDEGGNWSLQGIRFKPIDRAFPDYRRVFPSIVSGAAAWFDPELVTRMAKAGKAYGAKDIPVIRHNGTDSALVQFTGKPDFVGVIMPYRCFTDKVPDPGLPDWVQGRPVSVAAEDSDGSEFV